MNRNLLRAGLGLVFSGLMVTTAVTAAQGDDDGDDSFDVKARLSGFNEDPLALSTTGKGWFSATIDLDARTIDYELNYARLEGSVAQAHLHIGRPSQSGGVSAFLCSNGTAPAGTPACDADGSVEGTIEAVDVIGPTEQGIAAGEFLELVNAIEHFAVYANVHTSKYPNGEIRGQLHEDD